MKNYKKGLSLLMHSEANTNLRFKGPLGKSLRLQKHGYHVAFLAGTGVLVFFDLVAALARVNLGLISHDKYPFLSKGSTFKLVLYVSFQSVEQAIGL